MNNQYYIFTKELPQVLTEREEAILIKNRKNPKATEQLIQRNLRLVFFISKKYQNTGIELEELFSIGVVGLIKGIKNFKPEKGVRLNTFAAKCIRNEILMYLRNEKKWSELTSLSESIYTDKNGNNLKVEDLVIDKRIKIVEELETSEMVSNILTLVLNKMSTKEIIVFLLNLSDKEQKFIAEELNTSQSYISRILGKIYEKNRKYSEMKIHKNTDYKFIFLCTEEYYKLQILISSFPKLLKSFDEVKNLLSEDELSCYKNIQVKKEKNYFIMELPKMKESFLFIAKLIKRLEK